MKSISKILIVILALFVVLSCTKGKNSQNSSSKQQMKNTSDFSSHRFSLGTDVGSINDESFNQSAWEGLKALHKKYNVKVNYIENSSIAQLLPCLQNLTNMHPDIIFPVGFFYADALKKIALANPKQKYAIIDYAYPKGELPNVLSLHFNSQEAAFLAGYLAVSMSKNGEKVGFVGGIHSSVIDNFDYGYEAGVHYAVKKLNKKVALNVEYVGSFTDSVKGNTLGASMYDSGDKIIFVAAGEAGNGVIDAAKRENKWVIGVDRDQTFLAPKNILASVVKNTGQAVQQVVKNYLFHNTFSGGITMTFGLKQQTVKLLPNTQHNYIPKTIQANINQIQKLIEDKKIIVPYDKTTFEKYLKKLNT